MAAAFQDGQSAGEFGTIAKLSRVMMLAPVVISLGLMARRRTHHAEDSRNAKIPMPWFVLGFIALVLINSIIAVPPTIKPAIVATTSFGLAMALAAMGLETDVRKLRAKGLKPLLLGLAAFIFIAGFSLMLVKMTA